MTEVSLEDGNLDPGIFPPISLEGLKSLIRASIVHANNLKFLLDTHKGANTTVEERFNPGRFVIEGNNEAYHCVGLWFAGDSATVSLVADVTISEGARIPIPPSGGLMRCVSRSDAVPSSTRGLSKSYLQKECKNVSATSR